MINMAEKEHRLRVLSCRQIIVRQAGRVLLPWWEDSTLPLIATPVINADADVWTVALYQAVGPTSGLMYISSLLESDNDSSDPSDSAPVAGRAATRSVSIAANQDRSSAASAVAQTLARKGPPLLYSDVILRTSNQVVKHGQPLSKAVVKLAQTALQGIGEALLGIHSAAQRHLASSTANQGADPAERCMVDKILR